MDEGFVGMSSGQRPAMSGALSHTGFHILVLVLDHHLHTSPRTKSCRAETVSIDRVVRGTEGVCISTPGAKRQGDR